MKILNQIELVVKKSKFVSIMYEVNDEEEIKDIITILKKEHKKARHIPYAYKIDMHVKKSDDKEPANTAGSPILNIIEKKKLNHALIVVIRYFGGIKLGAANMVSNLNEE